jgi:hypothetical protein
LISKKPKRKSKSRKTASGAATAGARTETGTDGCQRHSSMADISKVPKDQFEAVIKALLNSPLMPANAIEGKQPRRADAKKPGPKKRR